MHRYSEHRREALTEKPQFQVLHKTQWRHTVPRPSPHDKACLWQSIYTLLLIHCKIVLCK